MRHLVKIRKATITARCTTGIRIEALFAEGTSCHAQVCKVPHMAVDCRDELHAAEGGLADSLRAACTAT